MLYLIVFCTFQFHPAALHRQSEFSFPNDFLYIYIFFYILLHIISKKGYALMKFKSNCFSRKALLFSYRKPALHTKFTTIQRSFKEVKNILNK
nr:MAG TPA: hypothetical protein [Caudoviricetes sp.]